MITLTLTDDEAMAARVALSYTIRAMAAQSEGDPGYDRMVTAAQNAQVALDQAQPAKEEEHG